MVLWSRAGGVRCVEGLLVHGLRRRQLLEGGFPVRRGAGAARPQPRNCRRAATQGSQARQLNVCCAGAVLLRVRRKERQERRTHGAASFLVGALPQARPQHPVPPVGGLAMLAPGGAAPPTVALDLRRYSSQSDRCLLLQGPAEEQQLRTDNAVAEVVVRRVHQGHGRRQPCPAGRSSQERLWLDCKTNTAIPLRALGLRPARLLEIPVVELKQLRVCDAAAPPRVRGDVHEGRVGLGHAARPL